MNIANPAHRYYKLWTISFQNQKQEAGESISAYVTELRVIAKNYALDEITPDEILHNKRQAKV